MHLGSPKLHVGIASLGRADAYATIQSAGKTKGNRMRIVVVEDAGLEEVEVTFRAPRIHM